MKNIKIVLWILFYLILIDLSVNIVFRYPKDPHNVSPSFLQSYFDYGRSVEGKLQWMTRPTTAESAPRVSGGWLKSEKYLSLPAKTTRKDEVLIALYGMSHTEQLWKAIQKTDNKYLVRGFMAAGATPNWSYASYEFDMGRHKADAVVLGILTDSVPPITSTTGMTAFFDSSFPYTFPRYTVKDGKLRIAHPPFYDAKGYIDHFYNPSKWKAYRGWLAKNDKYYDPLLFQRSILDHSAFFRLLRRAYSEREKQERTKSVHTKTGFIETSEEIVILRTIVKTFAESARRDDIIPVVYIVNSKGTGDHLFRILKPTLDEYNIPHLSTHLICPPDDPNVYLTENSHFIPSKDMELAGKMIKIIKKEIAKKKTSKSRQVAVQVPENLRPAY
ncbi:hypothetical protein ACJ77P_05255 [Syntrophus buswellii]|jgi:hypothetical protein|uniref:hypothetical protein n=1 Tax=Syntrophus buswellii TaxID=43774 RepID=UPI0038D4E5D1